MLTKTIREKLAAATPVVGSWISLPDTAIAEIMARSGFDFLTVDMEHSAITMSEAQELIRVISLCDVCPIVRLTSNDGTLTKRVLDAGAMGVIVPMVNTAEEAAAAVAAAKYPPTGQRSVGLARAQGYGPGFDAYFGRANADTLVMVQIEHIAAVESIDEILSVPGVDAFMVGPYDLSASMGIPGQLDHPRVLKALERVLTAARSHRVPAGFHHVWPNTEEFLKRAAQGFTLMAYSVDILLLGETCRRGLDEIRLGLSSRDRQ
jgi:2-keto-3-deoxy-L-rhamnonate aldolase RhmA